MTTKSLRDNSCNIINSYVISNLIERRCVFSISNLVYFIIGLHSAILSDVILAEPPTDIRCSHIPPSVERVNHVWLNEANFSAWEEQQDPQSSGSIIPPLTEHGESGRSMAKRHINHRKEFSNSDQPNIKAHSKPLWDMLKQLEQPFSSLDRGNELVPVKIQVYYDSSVHLLDKQKVELITDIVMPSVVSFFESVLSIKREYAIERFRISRRCPNNTVYYARDLTGFSKPFCMDRCENYALCGEMAVPQSHLSACSYCNSTSKRCLTNYSTAGIGVADAQLMLYVSAKQTARCRTDQTIAYAAHCAQDAKTDRPVAGHANLCPSSISTDVKDLKALIATVKHELTHVLGFSVSLFAYYRDAFGQPLTERDSTPGPIPVDLKTGYAKWSDKIIKKVIKPDWYTGEGKVEKEVHMIVTPTVVREVRSHFNCSTLEGAELEDQGSDGTSMTHWEKRLFENEAMTGTHTQNSVYSRITLAVLQDTGWYIANFSKAEKLEWGKDLGCDFAKKSCRSWIEERRAQGVSIRPFCDRVKGDLLKIACTEDRTSKAVCNMKQYKNPLPSIYQNFDYLEGVSAENLSYYGGSVDLADYCPFIQEFTWQAQNVTIRGSRCDLKSNNLEAERNSALEYYGPQTRCFEHGRRWEQRSCVFKRHWHHFGAGCYKYTCSNGHVNVLVGNHTYPCYYADQLIHIEQVVDQWLYDGTIICPPCEKVCQANKCNTYDKRVIDIILSFHQSSENVSITNDTSFLMNLIGDAINTVERNVIDTESNLINKQQPKQSANSKTDSEIVDKSSYNNHLKFEKNNHHPSLQRDNLIYVLSNHKKAPHYSLLCSSTGSLINQPNDTYFVEAISFVVFILILIHRTFLNHQLKIH